MNFGGHSSTHNGLQQVRFSETEVRGSVLSIQPSGVGLHLR